MAGPRLSALVSPMLRLTVWIFSPAAPGLDLGLGLVAGCWLGMQCFRPEVFDQGSFVGLQWAPDSFWIVYVGLVIALHVAGLFNLDSVKLRVAGAIGSSWYWLLVSLSLTRHGLVPGTWTYGIVGLGALAGAIYVSGRASGAR